MFDYAALSALTAVAREGSFDRAAKRLGITPSAVSQRIRALEERVGTVLIHRGQPCRPTEVGARLCAHADRVTLLEHDVAAALPQLPGALNARRDVAVRIAVNADSLATWMPEAIAQFARTVDGLIELVLDDEAHTADRLRSGEVVAAVTADAAAVPGCRTVELGALRYLACGSPAFLARHFPDGVKADALQRAPHLRFDRRDALQARWARSVLGIDLDPPVHWVPSTQGFLDLASAGLGWGMQPAALARSHLADGRLRELIAGRSLAVPLYWQVTRLGASWLDAMTAAVRAAARRALRA